jgi:hypothetical protein
MGKRKKTNHKNKDFQKPNEVLTPSIPVKPSTTQHPYIKSQDDYIYHLAEQMQFLKNSMLLFDSGHIYEAKRLALTIRVLVHDTTSSVSLLKHLGKKDILYYDTAEPYDPETITIINGMINLISTSYGFDCIAALDGKDLKKKVPFEQWWSENVIFTCVKKEHFGGLVDKDTNLEEINYKYTRKALVLGMANRDGGAHIDSELEEEYKTFTKDHGLGLVNVTPNGEEKFATPVEYAAIRQIAFELEHSIQEVFTDIQKLTTIPRPSGGFIIKTQSFTPK